MNFSNYRFTLDLHSLHSQTSIPVMLGDTGITWHINLCDGGKPYLIAEGCLAKISIKRPTGTYLEAFCEIRGNATIVYPFAQETCVAVGLHNCEITLYGVDGTVLGTPRFSMIVGDRVIKNDDINITDQDRTIVDAMVVEEAKRQAAEESRAARFEQTIEDMKESFRNSAVHIGPEAPENGETIWLDTNEEENSEIGVVAKVGQVLAVKSIGPDGKPSEYYGVDLPKVPTPNMNANEGEEGYVEGRTHYVDKDGIVHKLDNKYINAAWMATKEEKGGTIEWWQDLAFTSAYFSLNPHWYPDVGFDWDIYWNNTKYTCSLVTSAGECFLGNRSLLGSEYPDTGEPFLFYGYALTNKDPEIVGLKKKTETAETVNVVITTKHEVVYNTLPEAYLPADVLKKGDIPELDSGADIDAHNESAEAHMDIRMRLDAIKVPTKLSELSGDSTHRTVTDSEKSAWSGKENAGVAAGLVNAHNVGGDAHNDIRLLIEGLNTRLNAVANSSDVNLDQLAELVAYIKANRSLIEQVTTNKVSVSDIINNLTTNVSNKPLSAAQGVALKALIDAITVPTKLSELAEDSDHRTVTDAEKEQWNKGGVQSWNDLTDKPFSEGAGELWFTYTATFATDAAAKNGVQAPCELTNTLSWLEVNGELLKVHKEQEGMVVVWRDADGNQWVTSTFAGVYVSAQTAGTYTYKFYAPSDELMLEPKYLPPNLAKKSDIPEGGSGANIDVVASVGQTIVVEEVDADGKPTKWKAAEYQERTHWSEEGIGTLVPHTVFKPILNPTLQMPVYMVPEFGLAVGKTYTVVYDGVEYPCTAVSGTLEGLDFISIGNAYLATGTQTSEPFIVAKVPYLGVTLVIELMGGENHTIQINGEKTVYHTLPEYAPNEYWVSFLNSGVLSDEGSFIFHFNADWDELLAAIEDGKNVYADIGIQSSNEYTRHRYMLGYANIGVTPQEGYEFTERLIFGACQNTGWEIRKNLFVTRWADGTVTVSEDALNVQPT